MGEKGSERAMYAKVPNNESLLKSSPRNIKMDKTHYFSKNVWHARVQAIYD